MAKKKGNEELIYVATSAPTVATDHADAAYALLSNVTSWTMSIESDEIDGSDKDSGAFGDPFPGVKNVNIEVGFNRDFTGPTAQANIETAALSTTAAGAEIWWIKTTTVTGDEGRHGQARVLNMTLNSEHTSIGTASFTMRNIGAYTVFTE